MMDVTSLAAIFLQVSINPASSYCISGRVGNSNEFGDYPASANGF
jgi:hypothetical protein